MFNQTKKLTAWKKTFFLLGLLCLITSGTAFANSAKNNGTIQQLEESDFVVVEAAVEKGDDVAYNKDGQDIFGPDIFFEDEAQAKMTDNQLLAKESGLSLKEVTYAMEAQEAFAKIADDLLARYPSEISRVWMEPMPGTHGNIQFVGNVPREVAREIKANQIDSLVIVTGSGQIAMDDHFLRSDLAADVVLEAGYDNSVIFYDMINDTLQVEVTVPASAKQPVKADLLLAIQAELNESTLKSHAATIHANDLKLTVFEGSEPMVEPDFVGGGNALYNRNGQFDCTSGWAVRGNHGNGIVTAAHCSGINRILDPSSFFIYSTQWHRQQLNPFDVEYHSTAAYEVDDFYASRFNVRDVRNLRSTGSMVGSSVCEFGRGSETRTCNHTVESINVTVNYSDIGIVRRLVRVSGDGSVGGDSGGGWSYNRTAWGIHSGSGRGTSSTAKSYFTPVVQTQATLNVVILR